MATFEFSSEGIRAGFGSHGFFAHGTTSRFGFDEREYLGHGLPSLHAMKLEWSIHTNGDDAWDHYAKVISAWSHDAANWPMTSREDEIKRIYADRPRVGLFMQWKPGEVSLRYFLKADPAFATLVMGAIAAGREIDVFGQGFQFANEDRPGAAAPTVSGWTERKEPLILTSYPIVSVG